MRTKLIFNYLIGLSLLFFLLNYPGQNYYQTLFLPPQAKANRLELPPLTNSPSRPISRHLPKPRFTAKSVVAQDVNSKSMLFLKNPNLRLYPASTTKIMTALVSLDIYPNLDKVISITDEPKAVGHKMGLVSGEKITVRALLQGLLIFSGNDAALALAKNSPQGYAGFVLAMNQKAQQLGLSHTHFTNPSGVEEKDHYTSARDLAMLASSAISNSFIRQTVQTKVLTVTDVTGKIKHHLHNTNLLLGDVPGVKGFKTGWTPHAGECLVTYLERDQHPIIIVLLDSQDRFGETKRLIDWLYQNYSWYNNHHD